MKSLRLFLLFSVCSVCSVGQLRAQTFPTAPSSALTVNRTTGAITAPVSAALFASANSLGGSATWGSITGTLSAQTDLQSALDLKLASTTAATTYQPLDAELTAIAGIAANGLIARTSASTAAARTITGTAGQITVTNGDGVSGNPTLALPTALTSVNSITAAASTNFTAAAGSSGASLLLTQGVNGGAQIRTLGTGILTLGGATGGDTATAVQILNATSMLAEVKISDTASQASGAVILGDALNTGKNVGMYRGAAASYSSGNFLNLSGFAGVVVTAGNAAFGSQTRVADFTTTGNLLVGGTTDITGSGGVRIFGTTASTSTTSGALQVAGGAGFGGTITLPSGGTQIRFDNNSTNGNINMGTVDGNTSVTLQPFHAFQISRSSSSNATFFDIFDNVSTFPTNPYIRVRNSTGTMFSILGANGAASFTPLPRTSGSASYFTVTTPADTTLAAGAESIGANFTAATRQWATGALTLQRERVFAAPTNSFVAASTITTAINVDIADPIAGTNATQTNTFGLRVNRAQVTNQLVSTVSTGTAPFVVASTTNVANLNASSLGGATFAAPGPIGSTTAGTGAFTSLSSTLPIRNGGLVRTTADVPVTSNITLANVTGLSINVAAATTYTFRVWAPTTAAAAGGIQFAIGGTATVTSIIYEGYIDGATKTRASALGTAVSSSASATTGTATIEGTITVNAAGTLTVQFAQNTSNASASTVLRGATFEVFQTNN